MNFVECKKTQYIIKSQRLKTASKLCLSTMSHTLNSEHFTPENVPKNSL